MRDLQPAVCTSNTVVSHVVEKTSTRRRSRISCVVVEKIRRVPRRREGVGVVVEKSKESRRTFNKNSCDLLTTITNVLTAFLDDFAVHRWSRRLRTARQSRPNPAKAVANYHATLMHGLSASFIHEHSPPFRPPAVLQICRPSVQ